MHKSATFSDDRKYRYTLERIWDDAKPLVFFVMLNPSTADADTDDKTIKCCMGIAGRNGFGGMLIGNLYAMAETQLRQLLDHVRACASNPGLDNPVGEDGGERNNAALRDLHSRAAKTGGKTIVGWSAIGARLLVRDRKEEVLALLDGPLYRLGKLTVEGEPRHPSRLPYDTPLLPYR